MTPSEEIATSSIVSAGAAIESVSTACRNLARALADIEIAGMAMLDAAMAAGADLSPTVLAAAQRIRTQAESALAGLPAGTGFLARFVDLIWQTGGNGTALAGATMFRSVAPVAGEEPAAAQLDHVRLARQQWLEAAGTHDRWMPFGPRTAIRPLERVTYQGAILGRGCISRGGALYALIGSIALDLDFAASRFAGTLAIVGKDEHSGASRDFGTLVIASGTIAEDGSLDGVVQAPNGAFLGFLEGALYGPKSEEFGATFGIVSGSYQVWDPLYATAANLVGAALGRRSP